MSKLPLSEVDELQNRHDIAGVRAALMGVCSKFGRVRNLTIFPVDHVGRPQALCFVRMFSVEEEQHVMSSLGIGRFGGEMVVVLNLRTEPEPEAVTS